MGDLQLGIKITADGKTADLEFNRIRQSLGEVGKSAQSIESNLSSMASVAKSAFAAMGAAFSVKQLIETTDAYTNMNSKLKLATASADEYANAQKSLFTIAQNNKTALVETVSLYSRIAVGMRDMGASQAQVLKVVDSVGKALKVSGASTSEAASVTTQLSQALASGVLRGEEFNSVMENGPRLARAIADGLQVPIGALRQMATEGKLTSEQVIKALESQSSALSQEASSMQTTVGQAWQMLENAATSYIGQADQANGTSAELASTIELMANNFNAMVDPVAKVMTYIAKVEVGGWLALSDAIASVKTNLLEMIGQQSAGTPDPEVQRLMKLGQGQTPIDELAAKSEKAATAVATHFAKTTKTAKKGASDAEAAFKATIDANVKTAEDAARLYDAQAKTSAMRFDNERKQAEETARLEMKAAENQDQKLQIADELRKKQEALIAQETRLKEEQLVKDEAALMARINGVNLEIDAADKYNLKQSERIKLQTELQSLLSQQQALPEEKAQIQLESMAKMAEATKQFNDIRIDGETNVREEALRTLEVLSSNLEYAKEIASGLSDAFGDVGTAIGGMTVALAEYAKQQATISIQAAEDIKKNPTRKLEIEQEAMLKSSRTQIKAYGDMTQAAQGFFKKGTKGYEAMGGAVKVFRAFEMAQSVMSAVKQMEQMGGMLNFFTASLEQMGIISSVNTTKEIAQSAAKAQAKAVEGAANQGTQGDPYSAFARVAAWVALMAGLGIMISGGGGSASAAPPPPETGTGTVFGDPTAVSESIGKSIAIIEENSSNDLNYSADMLDALYQIRDALGGVENLIASDLTPAITNLMTQYGDGLKQAGFIFRDQKLSKVMASGKYEGYIGARVETESSQMMITVKKGQTMVAEYGNRFAEAFFKVIETMRTGIDDVGKVIGVSEAQIVDRLKGFKIKGQQVDIAGLSAEEAAKKLEAAFSAMSDTMAMKALPEFKDFKQSGEGYFETIGRVSEGINRAKGSLELLGMEAIKYTDIIDKNKDVAAEITRQTIMAQGDLSEGTREYVRQLQGSAADIIDSYKQILNITGLMRGAGFATGGLDREMINAAGGLSAFEESLLSFRENFMTEEQRVTTDTADLIVAFGKLGLQLPKSKEDFYALAMGIDTSTSEGKKLFAQLMSLNGKFAEVTDAAKELADAQAEAAEAARKAAEDAAEASRKAAEAAAEASRKAAEEQQKVLDSLVAGLQKNVDLAFSAMQKAYQDLQKVQERFLNYSKNIRAYLDELTGGRSAYISPEERYRIARQEFQRVSALAAIGDETALGEITQAGKDFLDASREYNASSQQFQDDFAAVTSALESSAGYAEAQANLAANQLRVAESSYSALVTINNSTLGVMSAITALNATMASYANAVAGLAAFKGATGYSGGVITDSGGQVAYDPGAPMGSPTNPIPMPRQTLVRGFAEGGYATPGLAIVGEQGPELVHFSSPGTVYTVSETQNLLSGVGNSGKLDAVTQAVSAGIKVDQAGYQALILVLNSIDDRLSTMESANKLAGAAA
jgi:tape measure domain-containing protein